MTPGQSPHQSPSHAMGRSWLATLLLALPAVVAAAEARGQGGGLFSPAEPAASRSVAAIPPDGITVRSREVTIDFAKLALSRALASQPASTPARLTLNLFDDTVLTAVIDQTAATSSGYSLSGRIEGADLSTVVLVVNANAVAGSVRTAAGTYRIRSVGKRRYAISEVDESRISPHPVE